ncbi:MAG TPA: hypothetical protein VGO31_06415 [Microbacteriaceae bacterium]|jgi:hypothetical protein|nr:hypothetical protein [Microbacteriaceae bacterium]
MIGLDIARALRHAGMRWRPASGDAFVIDRPELESDVFTVSDMTIEPHEFDTGTILGFNGTTEWALDSLALEDALWLPREEQLRSLLGGTFRSLRRIDVDIDGDGDGGVVYRVDITLGGGTTSFEAADPAVAYASALLALIEAADATH